MRELSPEAKSADLEMRWVDKECPQFSVWRDYAVRWIKHSNRNSRSRLRSACMFIEEYLLKHSLPTHPGLFLHEGIVHPDFVSSIAHRTKSEKGRKENNDLVADFMAWILEGEFSETSKRGDSILKVGYCNPFQRVQKRADRTIDDPQMRPHIDKAIRWVIFTYPELRDWRELAVEWIAGQTGSTKPRLQAIQSFFREFIIEQGLPTEPKALLNSTTEVPNFYTVCASKRAECYARPWTNHIHSFVDWVLISKFSEVGENGMRVLQSGYRNPITAIIAQPEKVGRTYDLELRWVTAIQPSLEKWRAYAAAWVKQEKKGIDIRLKALVVFFERYLIGQNLPTEPAFLLQRNIPLPDFYLTCCTATKSGEKKEGVYTLNTNNRISDFLDWVLINDFSVEDDDGFVRISPAFRNPVRYQSHSGGWVNRESVFSPLPFAFVEDLRQILVEGPNFRDWTWAQNELGAEVEEVGTKVAPDWFAVNEEHIDKNDPDCVWRVRRYEAGHHEYQMWSPVRWVALLIKLQIPLRTLQVRLLDSGEADTWRFANGIWHENKHMLAEGTQRRPLAQGVFRRIEGLSKDLSVAAILYVNTNKTADQKTSGPAKGFELPWPSSGQLHQNPYYWLEKLRDWQEKYNPITRRTPWSELDTRHISLKSPEQPASYPSACFLFRQRELPIGERHLPVTISQLNKPWFNLLKALQDRMEEAGHFDDEGIPFVFVPPPEKSNYGATTYFPLHSLRVSLITALALDGQVPFPLLQKLAGHSRLVMTLYYTKLSPGYMNAELASGMARMEANKSEGIKRFVADATHEELLAKAICNNAASLKAAVAEDPGARNPAGWMLLHHGMCLVGGNTSEVEDNKRIGGCHNGGPNVGTDLQPKWAPVPGGSRNCVRCRWFMTRPPYLPNLVATFNNFAYQFDEARNQCLKEEQRLQEIKKQKFEVESSGKPFTQTAEFRQVERVYELAMKRFSDIAENLVATWRLIERCLDAIKGESADGTQLIAVGTVADVKIVFEETESELLQLSGVCENAEVIPDLDAGKAVLRRSQLLDLALVREGKSPPFMAMSEDEQLKVGNAFMRQLAEQASPGNVEAGVRRVVELIDAGAHLGTYLGIDLASVMPSMPKTSSRIIQIKPVIALEAQ